MTTEQATTTSQAHATPPASPHQNPDAEDLLGAAANELAKLLTEEDEIRSQRQRLARQVERLKRRVDRDASKHAGEAGDGRRIHIDWRRVPLADALKLHECKRVGRRKLQLLTDYCPTIGDFEAIRNKARLACLPLANFLPKGVGAELADDLESRAVEWLYEWSQESQDCPQDAAQPAGEGGSAS